MCGHDPSDCVDQNILTDYAPNFFPYQAVFWRMPAANSTRRGGQVEHYDEIIVGAGSAGAVIAARLSQTPERQVLLLEAGPDYPSVEETPEDLRDPWISLVAHDWGFNATGIGGARVSISARQGYRRLIGGQQRGGDARIAAGLRSMG